MKRYLFIALASLLTFGWTACSDDDEIKVTPTATGTLTDAEGNEYPWVRIGNLDWMAEDLKCGEPFDDTDEALTCIEDYGNFYYIDEALAYCPEGWRLPTDEDWQALERALGMPADEAASLGWRGTCGNLMKQSAGEGGTGLNMSCNGYMCTSVSYGWEEWNYYGEYGCYWSSTKDSYPGENYYFRKICAVTNQVMRQSINSEETRLSVRYVRDAIENQ